jgi:hypothetical protein
MKAELKTLLNELEDVGRAHEELYDSEVRERMGEVIFLGFLKPEEGYQPPTDFGLYSDEANERVRKALLAYIEVARAAATVLGLTSFHARLAGFQTNDVRSDEGQYFDDFFGWMNPASFDSEGNLALPANE